MCWCKKNDKSEVCLWIVSVDKELWIVDEHNESSARVQEEVDEVVLQGERRRQVCQCEAHSRPIKVTKRIAVTSFI